MTTRMRPLAANRMRKARLGLQMSLCVFLPLASLGQGEVVFPAAHRSGGMPLFSALQRRHSTQVFAARKIPWDIVGNLLWAGYGITRRQTGIRTAPAYKRAHEVEVYLLAEAGVWRYDAEAHRLEPIQPGDYRALAGKEPHVQKAPLSLLYVADPTVLPARGTSLTETDKRRLSALHVGHITQNIQLFCASEGLGIANNAVLDTKQAIVSLDLPAYKWAVAAQTIGYPGP